MMMLPITKKALAFIAMYMFVVHSYAQILQSVESDKTSPPNFILIFVDDMGYGDIGPFGSTLNRTPNLDRMAKEGMRLTSFYAAPLCTPSRAALMTGSYPKRVGLMQGSWHGVLMPGDEHGLNPDEITIAEVLNQQGYATGIIGKWHLGDQKPFLPTHHGFDSFYGIPYSNDMIPSNTGKKRNFPPLPLMRDEKVVREITDQSTFTGDFTKEALKFIRSNAGQPFFLYMPHPMVHKPLSAGEAFKGTSNNGLYGDAVEEIDWSVGQILDELKNLGIDDNTLVVFTSDNGPTQEGEATPLRGNKGSTFEGGIRVPCLVHWPGKIPAGRTFDGITSTMDLLPTFAKLAGGSAPYDCIIDGKDISDILKGVDGAVSPYKSFYFYQGANLTAVRSGKWKLHLTGDQGELALYNLKDDVSEKFNVIKNYPEVAEQLYQMMEEMRDDLGDGLKYSGENIRPVGFFNNPKPIIPSINGLPVGRGNGAFDPAMWPSKHQVN